MPRVSLPLPWNASLHEGRSYSTVYHRSATPARASGVSWESDSNLTQKPLRLDVRLKSPGPSTESPSSHTARYGYASVTGPDDSSTEVHSLITYNSSNPIGPDCHASPQHPVPAYRQSTRRLGGLRRQQHHQDPESRPAGLPRGALRQRLRHHAGVCRQPGQLPYRPVRAPPPVHVPNPAAAQGVQRHQLPRAAEGGRLPPASSASSGSALLSVGEFQRPARPGPLRVPLIICDPRRAPAAGCARSWR